MTDLYSPTFENPGRILIVDDLPGNLLLLERQFRHEPFQLDLAKSAEEALDLCATREYEGILMDVSLPLMNGIEACRRLREAPLNADTPLIFISAVRTGEDWVAEGIDAGGIDYLIKPYAPSELRAKMRMMVRLSRQRQTALAGERHRSLLEIAGGTAHELAQPLAAAQIMLDQLLASAVPPTPQQLEDLRDCLANTNRVLYQIQNLHKYVTKPYASGRILDLALSSEPTHPAPLRESPDPGLRD